MSALRRIDGELWLEGVRLAEVAGRFGTPCYVYSRAAIESAWRAFDDGARRASTTSSATR